LKILSFHLLLETEWNRVINGDCLSNEDIAAIQEADGIEMHLQGSENGKLLNKNAQIVVFSIVDVIEHNSLIMSDPQFEEYTYLKTNLSEIDTSCGVIYTGKPTLFKNVVEFSHDKYIELRSIDEAYEFVLQNQSGCFYVYRGYNNYELNREIGIEMIYDETFIEFLSRYFVLEKIIDVELEHAEIKLYYFEN